MYTRKNKGPKTEPCMYKLSFILFSVAHSTLIFCKHKKQVSKFSQKPVVTLILIKYKNSLVCTNLSFRVIVKHNLFGSTVSCQYFCIIFDIFYLSFILYLSFTIKLWNFMRNSKIIFFFTFVNSFQIFFCCEIQYI